MGTHKGSILQGSNGTYQIIFTSSYIICLFVDGQPTDKFFGEAGFVATTVSVSEVTSCLGGLLSISSKCLTLLHYCIFELFIVESEFSCLVMSCIYTSGLNIQ